MSSLAAQQQDLLCLLFDELVENATKSGATPAHSMSPRGLKAYKSNGHMLAEHALLAAYPVVAQLLGPDSAADLARALWHVHPPTRGDLALWGDALPDFLANSPQLQEDPYVADVARVEWALHRCATVADAAADPASLALLTTEDPDHLGLHLAPGCAVLRSPWPVASMVGAHVHGTPSFAEVGVELRAGVGQDVLVWRQGLRPQFRQVLPGEADLLERLLAGDAMGRALDQAPSLDFAQWFPGAIASQLVLGFFVQNPTMTGADQAL
ncbi:MAG: hypothetical protein CFE43_08470 [Burkholderiales bacterium PBB3]|nr:MAG: hypothetical protein CFE43_08470 [Burkholderiales bacterium PBB3]